MLGLHLAQCRDLIAIGGGFFKIEGEGRPLHIRHQLLVESLVFAFQKHHGVTHVVVVGGALDQADAGAGAAANLILQAGTAAIAEYAVLTLAHQKSFL